MAQLALEIRSGELVKTLKLYPILTDNHVTGYQGRFLREDEFRKAREVLFAKSPNSEQLRKDAKSGEDAFGRFMALEVQ